LTTAEKSVPSFIGHGLVKVLKKPLDLAVVLPLSNIGWNRTKTDTPPIAGTIGRPPGKTLTCRGSQ